MSVSKYEESPQSLRSIYQAKDFLLQNSKNKPAFGYDKIFENFLKDSESDDSLQYETLMKEPYTINQSNYLGNTMIHLAAEELKISHLRILIRLPAANLGLLNRDNRNIIHLLLMNLQKRWSTQRSQAAAEKKMCSRSPPPNEVFSVLSEIIKGVSLLGETAVVSMLTVRDRYELTPLDYVISLNNISLIELLLSEIRLSSNSNSVDWGRLLSRAILTNVSETVAAVSSIYVYHHEQTILLNDECSIRPISSGITKPSGATTVANKNKKPVDFIIQAIKHECLKSLHCLLLIPTFQLKINDSSSQKTDGKFTSVYPKNV
jgi:hypothetical protein